MERDIRSNREEKKGRKAFVKEREEDSFREWGEGGNNEKGSGKMEKLRKKRIRQER